MSVRALHFLRPAGVLCLAVAALPVCALPAAAQSDEAILNSAEASPEAAAAPDPEDVTAEVRRQNSAEYAAPPTNFHPGSVQPQRRTFSIDRRSGGHYRLKISSSDAILSPAVSGPFVFVGGGFTSREFHCIHAPSGRTVWSVSLSDPGPSPPVVEDGVVVLTTESCTMYALDARNGHMLWSVWLGDPVTTTPTIAGGYVLASYPTGQIGGPLPGGAAPMHDGPPTHFALVALDLKTGKPRWQKWIDNHVISAPIVRDGEVYAATFSGTLYKLRLSDGTILHARRALATSAPVVTADGVYFTRRTDAGGRAAAAECITKIDRRSGRPRYSVEKCSASYTVTENPEAADIRRQLESRAYIPDEIRQALVARLQAVGPASVIGRTDAQALQAYSGSRLVSFSGGLFNCMGGELLSIDPLTGKRNWGFRLGAPGPDPTRPVAAPPVVAAETLFVATSAGKVHRVDPASGRVLGTVQVGVPVTSEPIIDGGRIFLGARQGQLVCLNTGNPTITGWSQWGGNAAHTGPAAVAGAAMRK